MKSVNWPIVRFPAIASRPPTRSTAAIPSVGRKTRPGRNRASTDAWRIVSWRTASARSEKRSRTSSSRPNACTISIPTTASSEASVRWPFFRCTSREIGNTRCAKKYARTAIGGIATAAVSASCQFTTVRTIAAPISISTLWIACTTPQPMK